MRALAALEAEELAGTLQLRAPVLDPAEPLQRRRAQNPELRLEAEASPRLAPLATAPARWAAPRPATTPVPCGAQHENANDRNHDDRCRNEHWHPVSCRRLLSSFAGRLAKGLVRFQPGFHVAESASSHGVGAETSPRDAGKGLRNGLGHHRVFF
jgi:hypothetical protein